MAEPILIVLFLRGGADGLSLVAPTGDPDYRVARPDALRVLSGGDRPGHRMADQLADVDFRFHPAAGPLADLFRAGELSVVHATGLSDGTRSHFAAEDAMERAGDGPNDGAGASGWIGRWLSETAPDGPLPALAVGTGLPESLRGWPRVAVAETLSQLILAQGHPARGFYADRLRDGLGSHPLLRPPLEQLLALSALLEARLGRADGLGDYVPAVAYPERNPLAEAFKTVAQTIKLDLGLRVATVDFGGWDTHDDQAGTFGKLAGRMSEALSAFWRDLGDRAADVAVVVTSEFGRRLRSNTNGGTDHGRGNAMMVLGGGIRGGRMLGRWPGLAHDALDDGADLAVTTDHRRVLADVVGRHLRTDPARVFPGFDPQPVGLFG